jgi:hypothetical protein
MEKNLLKSPNESKLAYIRRIVYGKLVDKTIDEDYTILAPLVFEKEYSSDVARRMFYGVRALLDVIGDEEFNNVSEDSILKEIEEKRLELEKERKKLQATKIEYNRNLRTESRQELLYENIKDTQERLPLPDFKDVIVKDNDGSYVLCWTDLHYGADFEIGRLPRRTNQNLSVD